MIIQSRRGVLKGFIAAPFIVRAGLIMPVKTPIIPPPELESWVPGDTFWTVTGFDQYGNAVTEILRHTFMEPATDTPQLIETII